MTLSDKLLEFDYRNVFRMRRSWIGKYKRLESMCWWFLTLPHRSLRLYRLLRVKAPPIIIKQELMMMIGKSLWDTDPLDENGESDYTK